jgi:excisionase family DNA binding protein
MKHSADKEIGTILTVEEASQFLSLKPSRIRYEVGRRKMPFIKMGRSLRFDKNDLIQWVANQKVCRSFVEAIGTR